MFVIMLLSVDVTHITKLVVSQAITSVISNIGTYI